jgi:hypothetical protein
MLTEIEAEGVDVSDVLLGQLRGLAERFGIEDRLVE